jgi:K+ transporter
MEIEHYDACFKVAAEMMDNGASDQEIIDYQVKWGITEIQAKYLITQVLLTRDERYLKKGRTKMYGGIFLLVLCVAGTVFTYSLAKNYGGGLYVVSIGAILFGLYQIIEGADIYFGKRKPPERN